MDRHHCAYPSVTVSMDVTVAVVINGHVAYSCQFIRCTINVTFIIKYVAQSKLVNPEMK